MLKINILQRKLSIIYEIYEIVKRNTLNWTNTYYW
jgi:hypothetical protein